MAWRELKSAWIWVAGVVSVTAFAVALGIVVTLFPHARSIPGDQVAAGATVLGGLIGAAGTAFAVYLTLVSQRRDEAEKVEAALRTEVSEFGRLAVGALAPCESVITGEYKIPLRDLPALVAMPDPVVYRATADRISRLPYGSLLVTFHARIAESVQMATILAVTARPVINPGGPQQSRCSMTRRQGRSPPVGWISATSRRPYCARRLVQKNLSMPRSRRPLPRLTKLLSASGQWSHCKRHSSRWMEGATRCGTGSIARALTTPLALPSKLPGAGWRKVMTILRYQPI